MTWLDYVIFRSLKTGSGYPKFLHSAVFLDQMMFVFGGNTHNDTNVSQGAKCYSTDLMAYDPGTVLFLECHITLHLLSLCSNTHTHTHTHIYTPI